MRSKIEESRSCNSGGKPVICCEVASILTHRPTSTKQTNCYFLYPALNSHTLSRLFDSMHQTYPSIREVMVIFFHPFTYFILISAETFCSKYINNPESFISRFGLRVLLFVLDSFNIIAQIPNWEYHFLHSCRSPPLHCLHYTFLTWMFSKWKSNTRLSGAPPSIVLLVEYVGYGC